MKLYDFIFTSQSPGKYFRHFVFWFSWLMYLLCKQIFELYGLNSPGISSAAGQLSWRSFAEFPIEIIYIYLLVFFLFPLFFIKQQKRLAIFLFIILSLLSFFIYYNIQSQVSGNLWYNVWFHFAHSMGIGPIFIFILFIAIKLMKNYYRKMEEKEEIEQWKINSEMLFLKTQVQPHFLFNTLNNIYSFTLIKSPFAPVLIMKLSNLLHYMINECRTELVSLNKEIKMLTDYIDLEKVRYGKRLDIQILTKGELENKLIAPLLMIPFIENSFKHGASKILLNPLWIKLKIESRENSLLFELSNSVPEGNNNYWSKNGIGLKNVQKRLELLYPQQYELKIVSSDQMFFIKMKIPLMHKTQVNQPVKILSESAKPETLSYAAE